MTPYLHMLRVCFQEDSDTDAESDDDSSRWRVPDVTVGGVIPVALASRLCVPASKRLFEDGVTDPLALITALDASGVCAPTPTGSLGECAWIVGGLSPGCHYRVQLASVHTDGSVSAFVQSAVMRTDGEWAFVNVGLCA